MDLDRQLRLTFALSAFLPGLALSVYLAWFLERNFDPESSHAIMLILPFLSSLVAIQLRHRLRRSRGLRLALWGWLAILEIFALAGLLVGLRLGLEAGVPLEMGLRFLVALMKLGCLSGAVPLGGPLWAYLVRATAVRQLPSEGEDGPDRYF